MDKRSFLQEHEGKAGSVDYKDSFTKEDWSNLKTRSFMKQYLRKRRHVRYIKSIIRDLHWDIINTTLVASATGWTPGVTNHLENNGALIRKYERRVKWLRF